MDDLADEPGSRTDRRRRATHEQLRNAVVDLLTRGEPLPLTSKIIAETADVAVGTFYNHFESVEAAIGDALSPLQDVVNSAGENIFRTEDPVEAFGITVANLIHQLRTDPDKWVAARRVGWQIAPNDEPVLVRRFIELGIGVDPADDGARRAAELSARLLTALVDEILEPDERPLLAAQMGRVIGAAVITDPAALERLVEALEVEYASLTDSGG